MQTLNLTKKYEKYSEYKDSGVEWLGKIPKEWKVGKVKEVFNLLKERSFNNSESEILSLTLNGIKTRDVSNNEGQIAASYEGYRKIIKGDIVLNPMDLVRGFVDASKYEGIISPAYSTLRKKDSKINSQYYNYFFQKHYLEGIFHPFGNGVSVDHRWTLKDDTLLNFPLLLIPEEQQTKIAEYIDEKTGMIEKIIEKKQKQIELLREKRTSVINHAVIKGLDPKAELIESGIDWIGKIPKGREVKNLKSGFSFEKGSESGKFTQEFVGAEENIGEYPVYSGQTKNDGILGSINSYKYNYPEGVLFSTTVGAKAMTTKFLVGKFSLSQNCVLMVPNKKADSAYFNYLLEIGFKRMKDDIPSYMQPSLRVSDLNKFIVLFPDIENQIKIAKYLDEKAGNFDTAVSHVEKSIELLEEFKFSLISNVVTGKVRV